MKTQKIQVMVDDRTLERIDNVADYLNVSRSSLCLMLISMGLPNWENSNISAKNDDIEQLKIK